MLGTLEVCQVGKRYVVELTDDQRGILLALVSKGRSPARRLRRAQGLLLADEGATDEQIGRSLHMGTATVERLRKRFVEEGLDAALSEKPRPGATPKLDGKQEAYLVALACSSPPDGRQRWTLQLLADRLVELQVVDSISDDTVWRALKKTRSSRG
jgi:putative transposase